MITTVAETIAQDIEARTGILASTISDPNELNSVSLDPDNFPQVFIYAGAFSNIDKVEYVENIAGNRVLNRFDLEHIPLSIVVVVTIAALNADEAMSASDLIRRTYSPGTTICIPSAIGNGPTEVPFVFNQLRQAPQQAGETFGVLIYPESGPITVPIPFNADALNFAYSDRETFKELLSAFCYYEEHSYRVLVNATFGSYENLFATKKSFFDKVFSKGDPISEKLKNGTLTQTEFNNSFKTIVPLVPNLYERAISREPVSVTEGVLNQNLDEMERRANIIGDALGIERNKEGQTHGPRSADAAELYMDIISRNQDATMDELVNAFKSKKAESDAVIDDVFNGITNAITGGVTAAIAGGILGSGAARRAQANNYPDLLGSAGCAITRGEVGGCTSLSCNLYYKCSRGAGN